MTEIETHPLAIGDHAPEFSLLAVTHAGETTIALDEYKGKKAVVVYFYPKDDTPGCTREACGFRDLAADFNACQAQILGISVDSLESHVKFANKFSIPFPLLSDPGHEVAEKYGAWREKKNYGRAYWGIQRSTFVIDRDGILRKLWATVKVDQHPDKVLEFLRTL